MKVDAGGGQGGLPHHEGGLRQREHPRASGQGEEYRQSYEEGSHVADVLWLSTSFYYKCTVYEAIAYLVIIMSFLKYCS